MNKKFNTVFAILIALVLVLSQFGPVSAKPEDPPVVDTEISRREKCMFSPLKQTGPAPLTQKFYADYNGSDVRLHSWIFSDGANSDSTAGSVVEHTFTGTNTDPQVIHQVWFTDGTNITCSTWLKITVPDQANVPVVTQTPPVSPVGGNTSPNGSVTMGNDNFAPMINGDNNQININPDPIVIIVTSSPTPSATSTPAPAVTLSSSCSGYCASNGGTININPPSQNGATAKTMPTNFWAMFFYTILDGISSPFENWKAWLVENK